MSNAWKYVLCYIVLFLFGIAWVGSVLAIGQWTITLFEEPSMRAVVVLGYVAASIFAAVGSATIVPKLGSNKGP